MVITGKHQLEVKTNWDENLKQVKIKYRWSLGTGEKQFQANTWYRWKLPVITGKHPLEVKTNGGEHLIQVKINYKWTFITGEQ